MIYLFHGPGIVGILNKVSVVKKDFPSELISEYSSKSASVDQVKLSSQSVSLFAEKRLLVLEDFPTLDLEELSADENLTLILKFSKTLPANSTLLKQAQKLKAQIIPFPEEKEQSVFPFLDALAEKNPKALVFLEELYKQYGSQYLLTMIFYLLRKMLLPAKNLPPFVMKKMENQKKNFPVERINYFYKKTLETDFKIKSGLWDEKLALFTLSPSSNSASLALPSTPSTASAIVNP